MQQTVTLEAQEWQQLVAIIAQSTGYLTVQKLFSQLQDQQAAQEGVNQFTGLQPGDLQRPSGDGLDLDPPAQHSRRVPRP